jgi:hypothetical protein
MEGSFTKFGLGMLNDGPDPLEPTECKFSAVREVTFSLPKLFRNNQRTAADLNLSAELACRRPGNKLRTMSYPRRIARSPPGAWTTCLNEPHVTNLTRHSKILPQLGVQVFVETALNCIV